MKVYHHKGDTEFCCSKENGSDLFLVKHLLPQGKDERQAELEQRAEGGRYGDFSPSHWMESGNREINCCAYADAAALLAPATSTVPLTLLSGGSISLSLGFWHRRTTQ